MIYLKTELSHHGVKGMKWGIRHDKPRSGNSRSKNISNNKKVIPSIYKLEKLKDCDRHSFSSSNRSGQNYLDEKLKKYGDDFENNLINYGCSMCRRLTRNEAEAKNALLHPSDTNASAFRFYDYELKMEKSEGYVSGSMHVYGKNKVFVAGVENDYSDEERWYSKSEYKAEYPDLYKKHYG